LIGSLVAWSVPTFWLGILLLFWGSSKLGLPIGGKMHGRCDLCHNRRAIARRGAGT